jgi:dihydrodipicolinate synthase/N-acetylneuraminate lyase
MSEVMRGLFPVLLTPVDKNGDLDEGSLKREVSFCIEAGAHGLVFPVLGSEFQCLSEGERKRLVEVVIGEAAGQLPVVAGVAAPSSTTVAVECAAHAAKAGADAVIALPLEGGNREKIEAYYQKIASAARLPVFIQHSQPGIDPAFIIHLLREIDEVQYVKEEMAPTAHSVGAVVDQVGEECLGVFAGGHDRWMMSELHRGATGFMPAAEAVDVHAQVWETYQSGDEAGARRIFNQLLPLINLIIIMGLTICKEVMVKRGVFATSTLLRPGGVELDAADHRELDQILSDLQPLLRA